MKNTLLIFLLIFTAGIAFGQTPESDSLATLEQSDSVPPPNWKLKATYGVNGTQSSFVNWNAGGRNNIALLGYIEASSKYSKDRIDWNNDLGLALGGLQYIGKGNAEDLQKTDDRIDFASKIGFKLKEHWFLAVIGGFKSQFMDGFAFPNDSVRVSKFMAPGYVSLSLGINYVPNDHFSIFVSPLSSKLTFVQDTKLADAGAFGVEPAVIDQTTGDVISNGKKFRSEVGAFIKIKYDQTLAKNIEMKSKLELFSNYMHNPQNIDVNAEIIMNFKVNNWFSASVNWLLIYDDDIIITDNSGNRGPRTQFKSVIGLGVSYTMRNFKE